VYIEDVGSALTYYSTVRLQLLHVHMHLLHTCFQFQLEVHFLSINQLRHTYVANEAEDYETHNAYLWRSM